LTGMCSTVYVGRVEQLLSALLDSLCANYSALQLWHSLLIMPSRTAALPLILFCILTLFIAHLPTVTSQRLAGVSGENCVDQAYDGLQTFWCAQNECKVNLCSSSYQNWLFKDLLSICSNNWPEVNVEGYSASKCSGGTLASSSPTSTPRKAGSILNRSSPSVLILITSITLSTAIGFYLIIRIT